ncbi:MAG: hypothetical protein AAF797_06260 [Planctomycetota bacterium]
MTAAAKTIDPYVDPDSPKYRGYERQSWEKPLITASWLIEHAALLKGRSGMILRLLASPDHQDELFWPMPGTSDHPPLPGACLWMTSRQYVSGAVVEQLLDLYLVQWDTLNLHADGRCIWRLVMTERGDAMALYLAEGLLPGVAA